MNSCELSLGITTLANAIASNLSDDDLDNVASLFSQLGSTLAFLSVQRSLAQKACERCKGKLSSTAAGEALEDRVLLEEEPSSILPLL